MKKLIIILSVLFFLFLFYIGWCKISISNYFYKQLNNIHYVSGDYLSIPKNKTNHPIVFMYPISKNENFNVQVTGGTIVGFFSIYNTLGFKENRLSRPEGNTITFLHIDTSKPIKDLSMADFSETPIKSFFIGIFYRFFGYSIFNKGWGQLTHLGILVFRNPNGSTEIMKIK